MSKAQTTTLDDVQKLRVTIKNLDHWAQIGFSEIAALAKLLLLSLETPDGCRRIGEIALVLNTIWSKAEDTQNSINCAAEQLGCNYVDEAERRRGDAFRAFRIGEAAHA